MHDAAPPPLDAALLPSARAIEHLTSRLRTIPDFPQPGIQFKDITPLLADTQAFHMTLDLLAHPFIGANLSYIVAMEARGFIFGGALAARLNVGFVPVRKPGKLPADVDRVSYALEYGTSELQMHRGTIRPGARVLIVDDVLATGGTAAASVELVRRQGGSVAGFAFVCELDFLPGRVRLREACSDAVIHSLIHLG
ncbi:MAG: adenine phosphoribosyltransferase [Deltaproteobacteria bacterium]|nr:adenine phosphoribosyltransferase [Deltaproteobacteria bacterium]